MGKLLIISLLTLMVLAQCGNLFRFLLESPRGQQYVQSLSFGKDCKPRSNHSYSHPDALICEELKYPGIPPKVLPKQLVNEKESVSYKIVNQHAYEPNLLKNVPLDILLNSISIFNLNFKLYYNTKRIYVYSMSLKALYLGTICERIQIMKICQFLFKFDLVL